MTQTHSTTNLSLPRECPQGQPTRSKTASNRLRRDDNFIIQYDPGLIRRRSGDFAGAYFVDLGYYGKDPTTTLERAKRLRRLNEGLPILGVEIDTECVAVAQRGYTVSTRNKWLSKRYLIWKINEPVG